MIKNLLRLFLFIPVLLSLHSSAQRVCASNEYFQQQISSDPLFAQRQQALETFTEQFVKRRANDPRLLRTTVLTIPVVVHIVGNSSVQAVTETQVKSQIKVLNDDFRKLNSDASKVPLYFQSLAADCEITFCLAQQDPAGNPTNGIQRRSVSTTSFGTNDAVKRYSTGGLDAWNASQYLNIWVCNLSGGVLGYAQFPGGSPATDGVVVTHTAFGTGGTTSAPFNLGRTATHEVGHWLNLRHIWGDDGTNCTGSDQVDDTPNQADQNYGCPSGQQVSCSNGPNGDMYMNYMDYTDDACMYMFTPGQKLRMDAVLDPGGFRAALATSPGCQAPVASACGTSSSVSAANITQTSATVSWSPVSGATTYNLQFKPSSSTTYTTLQTSATSAGLSGLSAGTSYDYRVQAICGTTSGGYTTVTSFTTQSAACTDAYEENNSLSTAKAIPVNTSITALINGSSDNDYFSVSNTAGEKNIKVTLTGLPFDYDVRLYNDKGRSVAVSQNTGTADETLTYNTNSVGKYYVRVYGYNGAYSASKCYTLKVQLSGSSLRENESERSLKDAVKIFPVPASRKVSLTLLGQQSGVAEIVITNQLGAQLLKKQLPVNQGLNTNSVDVSGLANGIYFMKVQHGKTVTTHKLQVQH